MSIDHVTESERCVDTKKRKDYLSWSDTFMSMAMIAAMRSKDPETQVGACVVNDKQRIVAVGYNGMPNGCDDDSFPWGKGNGPDYDKHMYVCHAETNAIHNRNTSSLDGCTMYVTLFPCNECAKHIVQSGIKRVFYLRKHSKKTAKKLAAKKMNSYKAAKKMFDAAGVSFDKFQPSVNCGQILIDLSETDNISSDYSSSA